MRSSNSNRSSRPTEASIVTHVADQMKACGREVYQEVPLLGRSVDLLYLYGDDVHSIEFKLSDWKRGIEQARDYRMGSDFVYLCLARSTINAEICDRVKKAGIGLFVYDPSEYGSLRMVIEAPRSDEVWTCAKMRVLDYVRTLAA